jgi:dolichol-phosphate mannosyltransferase
VLALAGITSFSVTPLRLSFAIGVVTTILSIAYAIFAVVSALRGEVVRGWTSVVCFFSFLFGVQFIITGVLSEYLAQSIVELKRRPRYIVSDSVDHMSPD